MRWKHLLLELWVLRKACVLLGQLRMMKMSLIEDLVKWMIFILMDIYQCVGSFSALNLSCFVRSNFGPITLALVLIFFSSMVNAITASDLCFRFIWTKFFLKDHPLSHLMLRQDTSLEKKPTCYITRDTQTNEGQIFCVDLKGGAPAAGGKDYRRVSENRKWRSSLLRDIKMEGKNLVVSSSATIISEPVRQNRRNVKYLPPLPHLDHTEACVTPHPHSIPGGRWQSDGRLYSPWSPFSPQLCGPLKHPDLQPKHKNIDIIKS